MARFLNAKRIQQEQRGIDQLTGAGNASPEKGSQELFGFPRFRPCMVRGGLCAVRATALRREECHVKKQRREDKQRKSVPLFLRILAPLRGVMNFGFFFSATLFARTA
jgi:hypothetical protein